MINAKDHMILVMEYAKGGDLKDYIMERRAVDEEVVCKVFNQIVDAIRYCHKQRILHHDLKLQNILLMKKITSLQAMDKADYKTHAQDVYVKIADFGLSTTFKDDTSFKGGSLAYLSPEVLNKTKDYDSTLRDVFTKYYSNYSNTANSMGNWSNFICLVHWSFALGEGYIGRSKAENIKI